MFSKPLCCATATVSETSPPVVNRVQCDIYQGILQRQVRSPIPNAPNHYITEPLPDMSWPHKDLADQAKRCTIFTTTKTVNGRHRAKNKQELVSEIQQWVNCNIWAKIIQRGVRQYFLKRIDILRGPALKQRNLCLNASDFYTLDPIDEILLDRFFSYTAEPSQIYGFDIFSLHKLLRTSKTQIVNPYNRCILSDVVIRNYRQLMTLICIAKPEIIHQYEDENQVVPQGGGNNAISSTSASSAAATNPFIRLAHPPSGDLSIRTRHIRAPSSSSIPPQVQSMQQHFDGLHRMSNRERLREIFVQISSLGNHAQERWFSGMTLDMYKLFFDSILRYWRTYGISFETKYFISILRDPFAEIDLRQTWSNITRDQGQQLCIHVVEYFVFGGINQEYCNMGCLQFFTILTIVSPEARSQYPYLYESVPWVTRIQE
jgi:hypothetical protein